MGPFHQGAHFFSVSRPTLHNTTFIKIIAYADQFKLDIVNLINCVLRRLLLDFIKNKFNGNPIFLILVPRIEIEIASCITCPGSLGVGLSRGILSVLVSEVVGKT